MKRFNSWVAIPTILLLFYNKITIQFTAEFISDKNFRLIFSEVKYLQKYNHF